MSNVQPRSDVRFMGLPARQGRWLLIPLGMVMLLCLGSLYSWSVLRRPLEQELGIGATSSLLPYTVALMLDAAFVSITGFYMTRIGPRKVVAIGGLCVGLGYILSSLASTIWLITLAYGVILGTGVGIAYGVPMLVAARWFPDRSGLAVGLTIVGFGLSPLVTAPLLDYLIETYTWRPALQILGVCLTLVILVVGLFMKLPPPQWSEEICQGSPTCRARAQLYPANPLKTRSFYGLWMCYTIGTLVGLSAIGISSPVGEEVIQIDPRLAASSVSLFAVFNGLSRPLFGWLSDRYQPYRVAIASYSLILVACILMINVQPGQVLTYLVAFCLFWFCLGGWLAIAPSTTLRFFNPDRYAQTYGLIFTAYGVGALLGTLVTGQIRDWLGSYTYAFYPMAGLAIVGILLAQLMLKPAQASRPTLLV